MTSLEDVLHPTMCVIASQKVVKRLFPTVTIWLFSLHSKADEI